jgi:site-specific recombinase XerD
MTDLMPMPQIQRTADGDGAVNEAELAAAAFLARYQGRTLDAYRYDLRAFFQWAADDGLDILKATRPQIELYVRAMEARGLAATTIDRRLSTVCGFYRFANIKGACLQPGPVRPASQGPS